MSLDTVIDLEVGRARLRPDTDIKFEADDISLAKGRGTMAEWLDRARSEFVDAGLCIAVFQNDHDQLHAGLVGSEADDAIERFVFLAEMFEDRAGWRTAMAEMYIAANARLFITMDRHAEEGA